MKRRPFVKLLAASSASILVGGPAALADTAAEIDRESNEALASLYASTPAARALAARATGILIFPDILKVGLIVGAQGGVGALRRRGSTVGYYRTRSLSYGLQAGAQKFGYALFFMSENALGYLNRSDGWEIGVGPSVVIVDEGLAKSMTTTTLKDDIYAFIFHQRGLMAGLGLQGTKITRYTPD